MKFSRWLCPKPIESTVQVSAHGFGAYAGQRKEHRQTDKKTHMRIL